MNRNSSDRFIRELPLAARLFALATLAAVTCSTAVANEDFWLVAGSRPESISVSLTGSGNPFEGDEDDVQEIVRQILLGNSAISSRFDRPGYDRGQVVLSIHVEESVTAGDSLSIVQVAYARMVRVKSYEDTPLMATVFIETIPRTHGGGLNRDAIVGDLKEGTKRLLAALLISQGIRPPPGTPRPQWLNIYGGQPKHFEWTK